jgi:ribulose-5-phosphate 4-epimerase/fuculose-1-phosphate aldolase
VKAIHGELPDTSDVRARVSNREWETRVQLAGLFRLADYYGWSELVFTHISARVPGNEEHFLLNPFGLMFDEVTASSLVKIDLDGKLVDETPFDFHPAGFVIHGAVHSARPDVTCVIHNHTRAGMAISMLECGLLPLSQHAQIFYENVAYHDYEGLALDTDECAQLSADLGDNAVMILRNHGVLVTGETVPRAFSLMWHLEKACQAQLDAMRTGAELVMPPPEVCRKTSEMALADDSLIGNTEWPALMRMLNRLDPSFRS